MWLGAGGVIAIFGGAWGCIWALRVMGESRWWRRPATPVAFVSLMICATLISISTELVEPIGELSRSISPDMKAALRGLMRDTYDPFWTTGLGLVLFAAALVWGSRRLEARDAVGRWWVNALAALGMISPTGLSALAFAVFHVLFMMRDPERMSLGAGANATKYLLFCGFFAWIGLLFAFGWGLSRGVIALRLWFRPGR